VDAYVARQPILDRKMKAYGYELLFRSGAAEKNSMVTDADQATSRVVMESFFSRGLENITGGKLAFVNFTSRLLLEGAATLFPKEQLVVEILEDVEPEPEIIEACRNLYDRGYTLAMDDFVYRPELDPLIELSQVIKFDFMLSTPDEISDMLKKFPIKGKQLLAEKIETNEMFVLAEKMGFSLFQGYFFSKPVTYTTKTLSPLKASYISLLREINQEEELDFERLGVTIRGDVALSYKLLKLVNSSYYGLRNQVKDVTQALAIIGTREIRKWVFMISLMGLSSDKPDEIIKMSMIRGRFLENLNMRWLRELSSENAFQTGLFSLLDILMDMPMESAIEGILLPDQVRDALIEGRGHLYDMLDLAISIERSDWDKVEETTGSLRLDAAHVSEEYLGAIKWCNEIPYL